MKRDLFPLSAATRTFLFTATAVVALQASQVALALEISSTASDEAVKKDKEEEELRGTKLDNDKKEQELAAARAKAITDAFPASPTSGKIEGKAGAGKIEASALTAASINAVADDIAADVKRAAGDRAVPANVPGSEICSSDFATPAPAPTPGGAAARPAPVLLLAGANTVTFSHWEQFRFRACAIRKNFQDALGTRDEKPVKSDLGGGVAAVGTAVTVASKLLQLVTPDWELGGIDVSTTDKALLAAVADAYIGDRGPTSGNIYWAGQVSKLGGGREVFGALSTLDALDIAAARRIESFQPGLAAAKKKLAVAKTEAAKEVAKKAVTAEEKKIEPLSSARGDYAQLLKHLNGMEGEALLPINQVVNQAAAERLLGPDGIVLTLSVESSGGGYYSQKAIWNVLGIGGPPYWVSGGAVVSYLAVRPSSQRVVAAGLFSCNAGYVRVSRAAALANHRMGAVQCGSSSPRGDASTR